MNKPTPKEAWRELCRQNRERQARAIEFNRNLQPISRSKYVDSVAEKLCARLRMLGYDITEAHRLINTCWEPTG